jgi:hypothetical protein
VASSWDNDLQLAAFWQFQSGFRAGKLRAENSKAEYKKLAGSEWLTFRPGLDFLV